LVESFIGALGFGCKFNEHDNLQFRMIIAGCRLLNTTQPQAQRQKKVCMSLLLLMNYKND
jgi:hypothetical protein